MDLLPSNNTVCRVYNEFASRRAKFNYKFAIKHNGLKRSAKRILVLYH